MGLERGYPRRMPGVEPAEHAAMGADIDGVPVGRHQDAHDVEQECVPATGAAIVNGLIDSGGRQTVEAVPEPGARGRHVCLRWRWPAVSVEIDLVPGTQRDRIDDAEHLRAGVEIADIGV